MNIHRTHTRHKYTRKELLTNLKHTSICSVCNMMYKSHSSAPVPPAFLTQVTHTSVAFILSLRFLSATATFTVEWSGACGSRWRAAGMSSCSESLQERASPRRVGALTVGGRSTVSGSPPLGGWSSIERLLVGDCSSVGSWLPVAVPGLLLTVLSTGGCCPVDFLCLPGLFVYRWL